VRLLAVGRDCDVFDLGDGTVLRRNRAGRSLEAEAAVMAHAAAHGFPCPGVHRSDGPDLVLDLVPGPTMLDDLSTDLTAARGAAVGAGLGELHDRLHRIPGLRRDTLLHLDLHPANVLLGPDGPVVIDWTNAADGPAGLDIALTWLTLVPFIPLAPEVVPAMIDALLVDGRRGLAEEHVGEAAALRLADANLSDDEKAAIAAFVSASG
jgi:Ser/Thr protein kinase RdoA (MazF antagonist)